MASGTIKMTGWKLLWQNPDPNATFAPQTVSVPGASAYTLFLFVFTQAPNVGGFGQYAHIGIAQDVQYYGKDAGKDSRRDTQASNLVNNQCVFGKGQKYNSYGTATDDNSQMLPYQIWGIQ